MYFTEKSVLSQEENGLIKSFYSGLANGYCFTLTTLQKLKSKQSVFETYYRTNQPCYGEMRKYKSTHEDCTAPEDKPGDLHDPFPFTGDLYRITVGYPINSEFKSQKVFMEYLLTESPMSKAIIPDTPSKVIKYPEAMAFAFSANAEPTVLVNMFKNCMSWLPSLGVQRWENLRSYGLTKDQALFAMMFLSSTNSGYDNEDDYLEDCDCETCKAFRENNKKEPGSADKVFLNFINTAEYTNTNYPSPKKFFSGDFNCLSHDGNTWQEGASYSRKQMDKPWEYGGGTLTDTGDIYSAKSIAEWANEKMKDKKVTEKEAYVHIFSIIDEYEQYLDDIFSKKEEKAKKIVAKKINLLEKA